MRRNSATSRRNRPNRPARGPSAGTQDEFEENRKRDAFPSFEGSIGRPAGGSFATTRCLAYDGVTVAHHDSTANETVLMKATSYFNRGAFPRFSGAAGSFIACSLLFLCGARRPVSLKKSAAARETLENPSRLTIDRIYQGNEFQARSVAARWLPSSPGSEQAFTTLEDASTGGHGQDIVRHATDGSSSIMVSASELTPAGQTTPLQVEDYSWSEDLNLLLVFTNSQRVWRDNTRGDYWLLDRSSRQLRKLGGDAPASTMMFAKISPTGEHVAFVRERNIFLEDLLDHSIRPLTSSNSDDVINGTTDWVYEEELGLRDAFQWSPDGKTIAYWQVDTTAVPKFPLINNTDSLYPQVHWFAYPKVGQRNPICRVGVVDCESARTRWISIPGDAREHYLPRMAFLPHQDDAGGQTALGSATQPTAKHQPFVCRRR